MIFNTIHHDIRNAAGLSLLDYCLLESIYLLSKSPNARYTDWCNASKEYFSYLTSDRNLRKRYNYLVEQGYMEFKDSKRRMLKRTTAKYYDEVYSYVSGEKKLGGGNKVPTKGGTKCLGGGNKVPARGEQTSSNRDRDRDIDRDKTKEVVSIPKTKSQQFAQAIEQAEFPASFPPNLNAFLKRFFSNLNEMHPQTFNRPQQLNKIIKQVYNIREAGHSDEYLIKLIAKCNEQGWKSVSVDYLKDETNSAKFFNDGGVMRPNSVKIN